MLLDLMSRPASPMRRLAILLPQVRIRQGDNCALRTEWRPRSAHPLECDRERGVDKRQRCSSVDGDYVFHGACKYDTVSVLIVYIYTMYKSASWCAYMQTNYLSIVNAPFTDN